MDFRRGTRTPGNVAPGKLATGEEYWVGNRKLVRADADSVKERIAFWRGEVAKLEALEQGKRGLRRSWRVVPRDI